MYKKQLAFVTISLYKEMKPALNRYLLWLLPCEVCHCSHPKIPIYLNLQFKLKEYAKQARWCIPACYSPAHQRALSVPILLHPLQQILSKYLQISRCLRWADLHTHWINSQLQDWGKLYIFLECQRCSSYLRAVTQTWTQQLLSLIPSHSSHCDSHFHQASKSSNTLTLPLSVCLHVLCQFSHKNLSITSPSTHPKMVQTPSFTALNA